MNPRHLILALTAFATAAGLATVHIDRERDLGEYWEPNVWIVHTL